MAMMCGRVGAVQCINRRRKNIKYLIFQTITLLTHSHPLLACIRFRYDGKYAFCITISFNADLSSTQNSLNSYSIRLACIDFRCRCTRPISVYCYLVGAFETSFGLSLMKITN